MGQSILLVADGAVLQRDGADDIVDLGGGDGEMIRKEIGLGTG